MEKSVTSSKPKIKSFSGLSCIKYAKKKIAQYSTWMMISFCLENSFMDMDFHFGKGTSAFLKPKSVDR